MENVARAEWLKTKDGEACAYSPFIERLKCEARELSACGGVVAAASIGCWLAKFRTLAYVGFGMTGLTAVGLMVFGVSALKYKCGDESRREAMDRDAYYR